MVRADLNLFFSKNLTKERNVALSLQIPLRFGDRCCGSRAPSGCCPRRFLGLEACAPAPYSQVSKGTESDGKSFDRARKCEPLLLGRNLRRDCHDHSGESCSRMRDLLRWSLGESSHAPKLAGARQCDESRGNLSAPPQQSFVHHFLLVFEDTTLPKSSCCLCLARYMISFNLVLAQYTPAPYQFQPQNELEQVMVLVIILTCLPLLGSQIGKISFTLNVLQAHCLFSYSPTFQC